MADVTDIRIGFDGSFINFTARHVSVLSGPHAVAHFPPLITIPRLASPRANNLLRDENNYLHRF